MAKPRAPISTRLRKRDKSGNKAAVESDVFDEDDKNEPFSPRADPDIYLDELQVPISFVRGSSVEREKYIKEENELTDMVFGKSNLKRRLVVSTFYNVNVGAPVPSKRTRHLQQLQANDSTAVKRNNNSNNNSANGNGNGNGNDSDSDNDNDNDNSSSKDIKSTHTLTYNHRHHTTTTIIIIHPTINEKIVTPPPITSAAASKTKATATTTTTTTTTTIPKSSPPTVTTTALKSKPKIKTKSKVAKAEPQSTSPTGATVPVPLCGTIPSHVELSAKEKEKEYWRRQRRLFVQTRFVTNDEGVLIANTVYSNMYISPTNRMVTSFQGNIANFRTKLRRVLNVVGKELKMTLEFVSTTDSDALYEYLKNKTNVDTVKTIWGHWIQDPFVDTKEFYANHESVELLLDITIQLLIIHFQEQYQVLTPKQARNKTRALDNITRKLNLPDNSEFP